MSYDYAKVCLNGHTLIEPTPVTSDQYCEKCGAKVISACPSCGTVIKRWEYDDDDFCIYIRPSSFDKPFYCRVCGKPYPWTESALEAVALVIQEDEELSALEQERLQESLPDIITETPKTNLAAVRIKKALLKAGAFTADALRQFTIDFGCELAVRAIGLDPSLPK